MKVAAPPAELRHTDEIVADLLAGIRETVRPLLHLTDADLRASNLDPALVRLQLNLRRILREHEAAEAAET